ncbi:conserved Plasmodium protein, unknown function [Plasmodium malariae]|uniref:MORN repeat protein n=1 Tax=Plasmodium malariae TaxID=5858 RepID=A0A1C3KFL6_PLAMA|nr:conserved Plasmodium protein, unknown function [Plasmodium malariae]
MRENTWNQKDPLHFIINEEEEFLNIFNYKNVKCYKSSSYIYIGQTTRENEDCGGKENECEGRNKKSKDIKKTETKEYASNNQEKTDKKKKKISNKNVKDGYGILITLSKNISNEEILVNKFIGNWNNGKKSGLGLNIFLNKNIYFGYYENNLRNGWGYFKWKNSGSTYEGNWLNNSMNGKGMYRNRSFTFDGAFYNNKFMNSYGEWVDVFELERRSSKTTMVNTNIISRNSNSNSSSNGSCNSNNNGGDGIDLILLPFDFLKINLKKIAHIIKYSFNKIPFIMCSKKFTEKYTNFNLSKLIFLSYYCSSAELISGMKLQHLLFDDSENNDCEKKEDRKEEIKKQGKSCLKSRFNKYNSSLSENSTRSDFDDQLTNAKIQNENSNFIDSNHSSKSEEFQEDNHCSVSNALNFSSASDTNVTSDSSSFSSLSFISRSSRMKMDRRVDKDINNYNELISNHIALNENESKESTSGSMLKEYIKNTSKSNSSKGEKSRKTCSESSNNNTNTSDYHNNSEENHNNCFNSEEIKRNEIHNLINKYLNIYVEPEDSGSDYSIMSSGTENNDNNINFSKDKKEEYILKKSKVPKKQEILKDVEEEDTQEGLIPHRQTNSKRIDINDTNGEQNDYSTNINKQIENEIEKIKIDINFLHKLTSCNLSCTYMIKRKIKKSLMMKYPFIISLNMRNIINKHEKLASELLLRNCKIPDYWALENYFGSSENKYPEEIFTPLYFDFNNSYKDPTNHSWMGEYNNLNKNEFRQKCNLNFFLITDLLVDETKDIQYLKSLIKNKFSSYLYLNNLFFVVIE